MPPKRSPKSPKTQKTSKAVPKKSGKPAKSKNTKNKKNHNTIIHKDNKNYVKPCSSESDSDSSDSSELNSEERTKLLTYRLMMALVTDKLNELMVSETTSYEEYKKVFDQYCNIDLLKYVVETSIATKKHHALAHIFSFAPSDNDRGMLFILGISQACQVNNWIAINILMEYLTPSVSRRIPWEMIILQLCSIVKRKKIKKLVTVFNKNELQINWYTMTGNMIIKHRPLEEIKKVGRYLRFDLAYVCAKMMDTMKVTISPEQKAINDSVLKYINDVNSTWTEAYKEKIIRSKLCDLSAFSFLIVANEDPNTEITVSKSVKSIIPTEKIDGSDFSENN